MKKVNDNEFARKVYLYKKNQLTEDEKQAFEKEIKEDDFLGDVADGLMLIDEDKFNTGFDNFKALVKKSQAKKIKTVRLLTMISAAASVLLFIVFFTNRKASDSLNNQVAVEETEFKKTKILNSESYVNCCSCKWA